MENSKPKVLFIIGGPGSGKGTCCESMIKTYHFQHLSTGDLCRSEIKKESEIGKEMQEYVSNGQMVPGEVVVRLLRKGIEDGGWNKHLFILDGFPRNFSNIENWNSIVKDEIEVLGVLYLHCGEEVMKKRILKRAETSGRSDDNEETLKTRIKVYFEETMPVIEHYKKLGKLYEVSADGSKEQCFSEIRKVVENLNLDKLEEINEIKNYLASDVDPYLKPMIAYLLKNKPKRVHHAIKYWLESEGEDVRKNLENE